MCTLFCRERDTDRVYWAGDAGKEGQTIGGRIPETLVVSGGHGGASSLIDSQTEGGNLRGIKEAKPMSAYANLGKERYHAYPSRTMRWAINFSRVMSVKYGNLLNDAAGVHVRTRQSRSDE